MINKIKQNLAEFDAAWSTYEQYYVYELMVIETDSRRFIIEAIKINEELKEMETQSENITMIQYNDKRTELIQFLS
jgi:hypothetical protein